MEASPHRTEVLQLIRPTNRTMRRRAAPKRQTSPQHKLRHQFRQQEQPAAHNTPKPANTMPVVQWTACSTMASRSATQETEIVGDEELEAIEAVALQPEAVESMAGALEAVRSDLRRHGYPVLNVGRRAASRVDIGALIKLTNHSLGTLERSVERLWLNVECLYPQSPEDDFILGTIHAVRQVRPEWHEATRDNLQCYWVLFEPPFLVAAYSSLRCHGYPRPRNKATASCAAKWPWQSWAVGSTTPACTVWPFSSCCALGWATATTRPLPTI